MKHWAFVFSNLAKLFGSLVTFVGLVVTTAALTAITVTAVQGDTSLKTLNGLSRIADTPDHRLWLVTALCALLPLLGVATGARLARRSWPSHGTIATAVNPRFVARTNCERVRQEGAC